MRKQTPNRTTRSSLSKITVLPVLSLAALLATGNAHASGFALNEMSAAGVGNAHAGGAASAEDLSTIFFNPAGLSRMSGTQFMVVGSGIRPSAKFSNSGSTSAVGTAMTGSNGGDAGDWSLVPAIYYAMDLTPQIRFGIGLQTPFGLKTDYDAGWVGRYQALTSELKSFNINPTLSYKLNDAVSLGAGISAQYVDVTLSQAIDFGSVCVGSLGAGVCAPLGFLPQAKDGKATITGNDWGYGYNLGALFSPNASSRFGIAYRSKITHNISGDASYDKPAGLPAPLAASVRFTNGGASAGVTLPESLSVSGYADLDPKWSVMGDVSWMRWSRFDALVINFANGAPANVTQEQWRDTVRIAIAANYRYNEAWKLRAGLAYDPTPVRDQYRTARIPDADRTWLSFGAQYKLSRQDSLDFGYTHMFVNDGGINQNVTGAGTLLGTYKSSVDILSAQYNRSF